MSSTQNQNFAEAAFEATGTVVDPSSEDVPEGDASRYTKEAPVCPNCVDVNCFGCEPDDLEVRDWEKHYDTCPERASLYAEACRKGDLAGESYKAWLPSLVEKHMESCVLILI